MRLCVLIDCMNIMKGENVMAESLTGALANIGTIIEQCMNIITGNPVLFLFFCGGLLGIGFKAVRQAKRAAK